MAEERAIKFAELTEEERLPFRQVLERALSLFKHISVWKEPMTLELDLLAAHAQVPMDFQVLAEFPDSDFNHDILGIHKHIDRETGKLRDCFVPRCAKKHQG